VEIHLLRGEAGRREEELALVREHVEREREERELAKRAQLTALASERPSASKEKGRIHHYVAAAFFASHASFPHGGRERAGADRDMGPQARPAGRALPHATRSAPADALIPQPQCPQNPAL
jgi:hypothetical protein